MASAFLKFHGKGVVNGDIAGRNVLIAGDGKAKFIDPHPTKPDKKARLLSEDVIAMKELIDRGQVMFSMRKAQIRAISSTLR